MTNQPMETMAISKFKATCLAVIERVNRTGQPIRITRFGVPLADLVPPAPPKAPASWLGGLRGTASLGDDLVAPVAPASEWESLTGEAGVERRRGTTRRVR